MANKEIEHAELKVNRINPQGIIPVYTNDLAVTFSDGEIFVTFSLIETPLFGSEEDFKNTKFVEAKAIAKLVMNPEFVERTIKVLSDMLDKYKNRE